MIRIYLITCKATSKRFIGFTQEKHKLARIRHRLDTDARRFANTGNSSLLADVIKYGISAFSFSNIELCTDDQRSARLELWITTFNTRHPLGYNRSNDFLLNHQEQQP